MAPQSEALREAVGVFPSAGYLQAAIDELLSSGFRRAELSLLAGEDVVTTGGYLQTQIDHGGLLLWVRTRQPVFERMKRDVRSS